MKYIRHKLLIFVVIFCLLLFGASVDDVFHQAAFLYSMEQDDACESVLINGLKLYPDDVKLNALMEKLKEKKKNKQQQQNPQEQNQDQSEQDKKQEEQPTGDSLAQDSADSDSARAEEPRDNQASKDEISEQEAKQILDAYKDEKKKERRRGGSIRVDKDW